MNYSDHQRVSFQTMSGDHQKVVMEIFNYYIENSLAAYPESSLPPEFFNKFIEMTKGYPAFVINYENEIVGFCFLHPYNPFSTFKECAEVTYFIKEGFVGKGIGKIALKKLESEAQQKGITTLLANISSENEPSIAFHVKNGFRECGRFEKIGKKKGRQFDIIWMQKSIN